MLLIEALENDVSVVATHNGYTLSAAAGAPAVLIVEVASIAVSWVLRGSSDVYDTFLYSRVIVVKSDL